MNATTIFITGGGGFIGREIVARHLSRGDVRLYLLEHPRFVTRLKRFMEKTVPAEAGKRVTIVEGDITQPGLGLERETAAACEAWGKHKPLLRAPLWLMRPLFRFPPVSRAFGIPYNVLVYSGLRVRYDARQAVAALEKHGIRCPRLREYLDTLIAYFKEHYRDENIRKGTLHREAAP